MHYSYCPDNRRSVVVLLVAVQPLVVRVLAVQPLAVWVLAVQPLAVV